MKCARLLATFEKLDASDIELILVDDGSTDGTQGLLSQFKKKVKVPTLIICQNNKGPGGARNSGLNIASGKYVWFVDSDDDINPDVFDILRNRCSSDFDFIDFDVITRRHKLNSMGCNYSEYTEEKEVRSILIKSFGRISSKAIRRELIIENDLLYPENCIYEDNPLMLLYPFYVKSFLKTDAVGYYHHEEYESVTRSVISPRYFDRMYTAEYGLRYGLEQCRNDEERKILKERFTRLYVFNTVCPFIDRVPTKNWLIAGKVAKAYRNLKKTYKLEPVSPLKISGNLNFRARFLVIWIMSYLMHSDLGFFEEQRMAAWGKGFYWKRSKQMK
tara:strand:- start:11467 stop:12459 length:993 start_codon:yes stop_codon:yes gene_type:complete